MFKKIFAILCLACVLNGANITDILGRNVSIKDGDKNVILTFYFEEYFVTTGEKGLKNIVGWSQNYWKNRRDATYEAFLAKFPQIKNIPDIGYTGKNTLSFEKIISLKPDVIIFAKNDYDKLKPSLHRLEDAKIAAVFIDFHDQIPSQNMRSMEILGEIFGESKRVKEINNFYKEKYDLVENRLKNTKNLNKPKVYVEFSAKGGASEFGATYDKKMWGAFVGLAGGENIAKGLVKGASAQINPEFVISSNPDIIIFAGNYYKNSTKNIPLGYEVSEKMAKSNIDEYKNRLGWQNLNAVKNSQIYAIYHDLSRHIFDFAGILFFAKAIHPEIFSDIDPNLELKNFFDRFYPVKFSGTWMVKF